MSSPTPARLIIEERWRQRLKDAELRLTLAGQYIKEVKRDFPSAGKIHGADGSYLYQQALQAESLARAEHQRVLKIFTDLIVHNRIPAED